MSFLPVRPRRLSATLALALAVAAAPSPAAAQSMFFTYYAGSNGGPGSNDHEAWAAGFNAPADVAWDPSSPVYYVLDRGNQTIRRLTPDGVTTLAGLAGHKGHRDGQGAMARFNDPAAIAIGTVGGGDLYVADTMNHVIRQVTQTGWVTTLAGSPGQAGSTDATGAAARFDRPGGIAVDASGNVYVSDSWNHTIRMITPGGVVTTLAGLAGQPGTADDTGSAARFNYPGALDVDANGNVYVADAGNYTLRKVTPAGVVTTLAGSPGQMDSVDGRADGARFGELHGLVSNASGTLHVTEVLTEQSKIRRVYRGAVTTVSGGPEGAVDGPAASARFCRPGGLAIDPQDALVIADTWNHTIRYLPASLDVQTIAGQAGIWKSNGTGNPGAEFWAQPTWFLNGSHADYGFFSSAAVTTGLAIDGWGRVYLSDFVGNRILEIGAFGAMRTLAGGQWGSEDGTGAAARFAVPDGLAVRRDGTIYVADRFNSTIRRVTRDGQVTTLAGLAGQDGTDDGTGSAARFRFPRGVAMDRHGTLYVADSGNHTVRKITPTGQVTTLAGLGGAPGSADGLGSAARFSDPTGIAVDGAGTVYVADAGNATIRKITPAGLVTTLAGQVGRFVTGDGTGTNATFGYVVGLAVDGTGTLYATDLDAPANQPGRAWVRRITPAGVVTTVAGGPTQTADGTGTAARFRLLSGVATDRRGAVYVRDAYSVRMGVAAPHRFEAYPALDIPDEWFVDSSIDVSGVSGVLEKVTVSVRLAHPYVGDLTLTLIGPDGTGVLLSASNGDNGDDYGRAELPDYQRTIFDDGAAASIVGASAPFEGSFRPQQGLIAFASKTGSAVNGTWRLRIEDLARGDVGVLAAWSIDLQMQRPHLTSISPTVGPARGGTTVTLGGWNLTNVSKVLIGGVEATILTAPGSGLPLQVVTPALPGGPAGVVVVDAEGQADALDGFFAHAPFLSDYDGDGKADVSVYRPDFGTWFWLKSSVDNASYAYVGWGIQAKGDTPVPGDFDGDGVADPTVFRPSTGTWFTLRSFEGYTQWSYFGWGAAGDVPVPGDYDGDAITDGAVYRPSTGTWYVRPSSNPDGQWQVVFGNATDVPVAADYDADGRTDIAVYRPVHGTWFVLTSSSGYQDWWSEGWGQQAHNDTPIPGNYNDDGFADLAVYRPATGTWFKLYSPTFTFWNYDGFGGLAGDKPVPADYDADGVTDLAIFRPSTGTWYVHRSGLHTTLEVNFGKATDTPLPRAQ